MANQPKPEPPPLIYTPAKRSGTGVLIMIAGPSGSGKTKSALRLAVGLAMGGPIGFCDTEHGRALYYADEFDFLHHELKEPFSPSKFELAAVSSLKAKHAVWICDSFSHEHIGPGGMLDMFEATLRRMAGDDFTKREQLKYTAWIEPKSQHKHMLQRLWQLNMHVILCCHAEKKLDLIKDPRTGKTVPDPNAGLTPVCAPDIPYAMTVSFMLNAKQPGVPARIKSFDKIDPLVSTEHVLDEDTGHRIALWASGNVAETAGPPATRPKAATRPASRPTPRPTEPPVDGPPPGQFDEPPPGQFDDPSADSNAPGTTVDNPPSNPGSVENPPLQQAPATEDGTLFPGDLPLKEEPQRAGRRPSKNDLVLSELIAKFKATATRKDHLDIVDLKTNRDRIEWFKRNKPDMHASLQDAIKESWTRTAPQSAAA
jgi:AAA domain